MTTNVKATPHGYHTVTPYMAVRDCVAAIDFYRRAFGAEKRCSSICRRKVAHAEILSEEEVQRRMEAEFSQPSAA